MPKAQREARDIKLGRGDVIRGIDMPFKILREEWNEYELEDGTLLRIKTTLVRAIRAVDDDDKPKYTDLGEPEVTVNTSVTVVARE